MRGCIENSGAAVCRYVQPRHCYSPFLHQASRKLTNAAKALQPPHLVGWKMLHVDGLQIVCPLHNSFCCFLNKPRTPSNLPQEASTAQQTKEALFQSCRTLPAVLLSLSEMTPSWTTEAKDPLSSATGLLQSRIQGAGHLKLRKGFETWA